MPGNNDIIHTNQNRIGKAELFDAGGNLSDLLIVMCARIARVGDELIHRIILLEFHKFLRKKTKVTRQKHGATSRPK